MRNWLRHFAYPSTNFYSGAKQSKKIWPRFSTPVAFDLPSFANRITYLKSKTDSWTANRLFAAYMLLSIKFGPLMHTKEIGIQNRLLKNGPGKFVKSQ